MNPWIAAIWWVMLIATVVVIVPMAVGLLFRAVTAARSIERYTAEALAGGVGIAQNTANVVALQQTIADDICQRKIIVALRRERGKRALHVEEMLEEGALQCLLVERSALVIGGDRARRFDRHVH